jgi:hypothetical protein
MRLYQITEAISLTKLSEPLIDAVNQAIIRSINLLANKKNTISEYERSEAIKNGTLSKILGRTDKWLAETITKNVEQFTSAIFAKEINPNVTVAFGDIKPLGYASGLSIVMNSKFISPIIKRVCDDIYDTTINRLDNSSQIVDAYFKMAETFSERDLQDIYIENDVNSMISTMIHEAVHVAQHEAQFKKGRDTTEYRSYIQKDKNKFYQDVNNLVQKEPEETTTDEHEAWRGSPQEINARSHQTALEFLKDSFDNGFSIDEIRKNVISELQYYMDKTRYAIYKRFSKQVYQEVMRVLDIKEEQLKKNKPK